MGKFCFHKKITYAYSYTRDIVIDIIFLFSFLFPLIVNSQNLYLSVILQVCIYVSLDYFICNCQIMLNLTKLEFVFFVVSKKNYFSWILDIKIHLNVINLRITIKKRNDVSLQDRTKALYFFVIILMKG